MINILSWNIQCGLGVDGQFDCGRIASVIQEMGDPDVICLQEVSRFDHALTQQGAEPDQVQALQEHFKGYEAFFGPCVNRAIKGEGQHRFQFGNLILSRLPVLQVFLHSLPQPAPEAPCKHMPRQATEVVIATDDGPLRLTTTHFEFHSQRQRLAQAQFLYDTQVHIYENRDYYTVAPDSGPYAAVPRPTASILCGDFNGIPHSPDYKILCDRYNEQALYFDAWPLLNGDKAHDPTCGVFDHKQWPGGPDCRDFFFVSGELKQRVRALVIDHETKASDHQPVMMTLS